MPQSAESADLPELGALVAAVDQRTAEQDLLNRIVAAKNLANDLDRLGDRLIGYYVDQARSHGHSWSEIGAHLGVSRQAAQQRYTPLRSTLTFADLLRTGALARLTPRTRDAIARGEAHARSLRHPTFQPVHLLLGILDDSDTIAVQAIARLGTDPDTLRAAVENETVVGTEPSPQALPIVAATRRVLESAATEALKLGHNYLGTEHLLLGLLHDRPTASTLTERGISLDGARDAVREAIGARLGQMG